MRIIEPVGRLTTIPPTKRSRASRTSFPGDRSDPFFGLLQDAMSVCQSSGETGFVPRSGFSHRHWCER